MPRRRRPPRAGALADLPPLKILTQIAMLQTAYYLCATVLILFTTLVAGKEFSVDMVLSWRSLRGDTTVGWTLGLCWLLDSFLGVIFLLLLVSRSKFVPDFALTIHLIHLIITSVYSRALPSNWLWWALQAASATLMTSLGIWSCQWRELRPINFGGNAGAASSEQGAGGEAAEGDGGVGHGRGRGRGKGRDGCGDYEMVGMKEGSENNV
ncbi:MAG: integral membrane [Lasallia pustulata]|uniref:Integral membrane n=1 Tax=Lasallia pustulata TaxID=136370 RepID=A0A5M8PX14_9LECA|nr:MAG: integral membrane [Lasallia pustulata]